MIASIVVAWVVIMLLAMYVESKRRERRPNRLAVVPPKQGQQPIGGAGNSGAAPKPIPAALKAELDQTPQWWTDAFHQILRASGAEHVGGEEWELQTFSGPVFLHREVGYVDCPCHNCRRICRA